MSKENKPHGYDRIALACQGGGSLGAYHIGAYQAMDEAGYHPDVVSGISIGAFAAALIAGNEPENRLSAMKEFWKAISYPDFGEDLAMTVDMRHTHNMFSMMQGVIFGQPNFFEPRNPLPQFQKAGTMEALSYYDTSPLRQTLLNFVDFDRINKNKTRLLLGAVKVATGELVFFDSMKEKIGPDHVIASGSMPPAFPPVKIGDEMYWDGGCVSNTPLEGIFNIEPHVHTLAFMIDLFSAAGKEPTNMDEVSARSKNINFASRTNHHIAHVSEKHNLKRAINHLIKQIEGDAAKDPITQELKKLASNIDFDIVHCVYKAPIYEASSLSFEFSRTSIVDRAEHGYADMNNALEAAPWLNKKGGSHIGSRVHRFESQWHEKTAKVAKKA